MFLNIYFISNESLYCFFWDGKLGLWLPQAFSNRLYFLLCLLLNLFLKRHLFYFFFSSASSSRIFRHTLEERAAFRPASLYGKWEPRARRLRSFPWKPAISDWRTGTRRSGRAVAKETAHTSLRRKQKHLPLPLPLFFFVIRRLAVELGGFWLAGIQSLSFTFFFFLFLFPKPRPPRLELAFLKGKQKQFVKRRESRVKTWSLWRLLL